MHPIIAHIRNSTKTEQRFPKMKVSRVVTKTNSPIRLTSYSSNPKVTSFHERFGL